MSNAAAALASPVEYASLEFSSHQAANLASVCLAALNAFRSDGSDHGRHSVSSASGTLYVSSALRCHHDASTQPTAQL